MKITTDNKEEKRIVVSYADDYDILFEHFMRIYHWLPITSTIKIGKKTIKQRFETARDFFAFANAVSGMYSKEDEDWRD